MYCSHFTVYFTLVILISTHSFLLLAVNAQGNGAVTFYRSGSSPSHHYSFGILRIYYNGQWGNVCYQNSINQSWGREESDVVCHQMGWSGSIVHNSALVESSSGLDPAPSVLDHISCTNSSYSLLLQCNLYGNGSKCRISSDLYDVFVACYTTRIWDALSPYNGLIRLVEGQYVSEGRVEVYCNGVWGTVCDDALGKEEANTMCRQLGYTGYVDYDHLRLPGNSTQPIWLDDVVCKRIETCLATCQRCPSTENHNCRHGEDFTVSCTYQVGSTSQRNHTLYSCINAGISPNSSSSLNGLLILGITLGCGIAIIMCTLLMIIACCCIMKWKTAVHDNVTEAQYIEELEEKGSLPQVSTSPDIIMTMEESPKPIRKNYGDEPRYTSINDTTNGLSHGNSGAGYYYEQPLTPPVFQGHPAPRSPF